jgi:hypothetical protein
MKKKLLPLAIAAAMAAPGIAAAADVSGYTDIIYTITDDAALYGADGLKNTADDSAAGTKNPNEKKFGASGELDFSGSPADGVTVRMDTDLMLDTAGAGNSAVLEQANFAWGAAEGVTVIGGVFNDPLGMESQADAPDMWGTNAGVIHNILDQQTTLYDNNLAGIAVAGAVGPLTGALVNDLGGAADKQSFALVANASPIAGLDLELGFASQDDQNSTGGAGNIFGVANGPNTAGNVMDFNVSYAIPGVAGLSVALDYLSPSNFIDSAYELMVNYSNGPWGAGVRMETVSWNNTDIGVASGSNLAKDSTRDTFHVSYAVASNLTAILEVASGDNKNPDPAKTAIGTSITGIQADNLTTLELIATF